MKWYELYSIIVLGTFMVGVAAFALGAFVYAGYLLCGWPGGIVATVLMTAAAGMPVGEPR